MRDVVGINDTYGGQPQPGLDHALARLADRQHGVVARRQLVKLGLSQRAIDRRLSAGRLHSIHPAVYAVGRSWIPVRGRWLAAVLACGPDAVLSHGPAAAHWDLRSSAGTKIDVTVPARGRAGRPGIVVHSVRSLHPDDRTMRCGIPVTTVPRTLLDLAEVLHPRQLERAFEEAERLRLLDVRRLGELCRRSPGRHGLRPLRALLGREHGELPDTRSELERRFVNLCREAGLPPPAMNVSVAGFVVDAFWPSAHVVAELDGFAYHRTRAAFENDRARDAALQLAGHTVLRFTHRRLEVEAGEVVEGLRRLLMPAARGGALRR